MIKVNTAGVPCSFRDCLILKLTIGIVFLYFNTVCMIVTNTQKRNYDLVHIKTFKLFYHDLV